MVLSQEWDHKLTIKSNNLTKTLISFFIFSLLFFALFNSSVTGSTAIHHLVNWTTDFGTGATSGSNSKINFSQTVSPFKVDQNSYFSGSLGAKSLEQADGTFGSGGGSGYITLLDDYSYINSVSVRFWIQFRTVTWWDSTFYTNMTFRLSNGTSVFSIYFYCSATTISVFAQGQTGSSAWSRSIGSDGYNGLNGTIVVSYYDLNSLRCQIYDTGTYHANIYPEVDSVFATYTSYPYTNWSSIYTYGYATGSDGHVSNRAWWCYIGDIDIETSATGGTTGGCCDLSDYSNIDTIYDMDYNYFSTTDSYIEFTGIAPLNAKIEGFELLVHNYLYESDSDFNNYGLYINGNYVGSPVCSRPYGFNYQVFQWCLGSTINLTLSGEIPVFELFHDNSFGSKPNAWYFPYQATGGNMVWYHTYHSSTSYVDGSFNGVTLESHKRCLWRLYYTMLDNVTINPGYTNTINLLGSTGKDLPMHDTWNMQTSLIRKTIFFEVYADTVGKYNLGLYLNGVSVGSEYGLPKEILMYHSLIGYTPLVSGNYTVSLYDGLGYYLNKTVNISSSNTVFDIWTNPNPSFSGGSITITAWAKNPNKYKNYTIGLDTDSSDLDSVNSYIDRTFDIKSEDFVNGYYSIDFSELTTTYGTYYLRMFGTNASIYIPLTTFYIHYVQYFNNINYIKTDLKDNVGSVDQVFNIYGVYTNLLTSGAIYLGNEQILLISSGNFESSQSINTPGTYTYYLKEYSGGNWITLDSVTVSITSGSAGVSLLPDELTSFLRPYYAFIGIGIIVFFSLLPLIFGFALARSTNIEVLEIPGLVYVAFFLLGVVIAIVLGLLEIWIILFVLFALIISFAIFWIQRQTAS
jgi:hypothetical protein